MENWEKEFLPWLASLPQDDRLEVEDLLLQIMAAAMDRKFHGRVARPAVPALASADRPGMN